MNLNVETMFSLFDTYVSSILNYGCEVWGNHSACDIEKIHLEFIKNVLCVRKNTNTSMVYFETAGCLWGLCAIFGFLSFGLNYYKVKITFWGHAMTKC